MKSTEQRPRRSGFAIFIAILLILLLVIGWHLLIPVLGLTLAFTGALWGVIVASIAALIICIILIFVITGFGVFIIGGLAVIWTVVAIILFPVIFPLLVPILILLLLIGFLFRTKKR